MTDHVFQGVRIKNHPCTENIIDTWEVSENVIRLSWT